MIRPSEALVGSLIQSSHYSITKKAASSHPFLPGKSQSNGNPIMIGPSFESSSAFWDNFHLAELPSQSQVFQPKMQPASVDKVPKLPKLSRASEVEVPKMPTSSEWTNMDVEYPSSVMEYDYMPAHIKVSTSGMNLKDLILDADLHDPTLVVHPKQQKDSHEDSTDDGLRVPSRMSSIQMPKKEDQLIPKPSLEEKENQPLPRTRPFRESFEVYDSEEDAPVFKPKKLKTTGGISNSRSHAELKRKNPEKYYSQLEKYRERRQKNKQDPIKWARIQEQARERARKFKERHPNYHKKKH